MSILEGEKAGMKISATKGQATPKLQGLRRFAKEGLWTLEPSTLSPMKGLTLGLARVIGHAVDGFLRHQCLLRASALTYTSLLSLVPLLALMFAVLKGLGLQRRLEPFLLERFTPASHEVVTKILEYIDRTNVGSLGVLGVISLIVTVVLVLKNMERSLNTIWGVSKGRPWTRTVSDYLAVVMITPLGLLVALSLTTYFQSGSFVRLMSSLWIVGGVVRFAIKSIPVVILWIAFTACYLFMPNTRVRISSALLGGVVGGSMWQLAQWGYVHYQIGVSKYNAIYGALSQLPILMVWIYISWVILLLGAEIASAHQRRDRLWLAHAMYRGRLWNAQSHAIVGVLEALGHRFSSGEEPHTLETLESELGIPRGLLEKCIQRLERLGWIAQCRSEGDAVVFKRHPREMPMYLALQVDEVSAGAKDATRGSKALEVIRRANEGLRHALGDVTVEELFC